MAQLEIHLHRESRKRTHKHKHSTWGEQADGHEQHVFLLVQVEFLQTNLELHQRLQQLQSVTRCGGWHTYKHPSVLQGQLH